MRAVFPIALLLLLASCVEDVAAPSGVAEPYSMYGILNPRLEMQTVLVSPIVANLDDYGASVDAAVTSTNLATGRERFWRDSVVVGERGQRDHVFVAHFRPDFGSTHRMDVARSDGDASTVEIDVPGLVSIEFEERPDAVIAVHVSGEDFRIVRAEIVYVVRFYSMGMSPATVCKQMPRGEYTLPLALPNSEDESRQVLEIDLREHWEFVRSRYAFEHDVRYLSSRDGVALMDADLEVTIGGESWIPQGSGLGEGVSGIPGVLSNVGNGFGFVAGGYNQERSVWPSEAAVEESNFFDLLMRPPGVCFDLCSCGLFPEEDD